MYRKKGIKGLLLDQRAVVSGIGNWVADELLYRCHIHPDQTYLNKGEVKTVMIELHYILTTAVRCLMEGVEFPNDWLFHRRWRNGGGGKNASSTKDVNGHTIMFIQLGGRSTALVLSIQKNVNRTSITCQSKKVVKNLSMMKVVENATKTSRTDINREEKTNTSADGGATLKPKSLPTRKSKRLRTT